MAISAAQHHQPQARSSPSPSPPGNAPANEAFPDLCLHEQDQEQAVTIPLQGQHHHQAAQSHQHRQKHRNHQKQQNLSDCTNYSTCNNYQHQSHILSRPVSTVSSFSADSLDHIDTDFDSRRDSIASASSSLSTFSLSSLSSRSSRSSRSSFSSTATLGADSAPSTRPLTRSRRDAKQLHAARIQRSGSATLGLGDRDRLEQLQQRRESRGAKDWDWTSRRAGSTSSSPSSTSTSPHSGALDGQHQHAGGLARMEQQRWIKVQEKTFTKWLNAKLCERNLAVQDLVTDLSDGVSMNNE